MLKAFSPYIFAPNHDFAERKFRAKHQVEETVHIIKVCGNAEDRRPFESSSVRTANFSSAQTVTQTRKGKVKLNALCYVERVHYKPRKPQDYIGLLNDTQLMSQLPPLVSTLPA